MNDIGYFCTRCRETLNEGQSVCPFCENPARPLDECISVVASWHKPDCEWHHEQVANECTCTTVGQRMQAEEMARLRRENADLNAALEETHRSLVLALAAGAQSAETNEDLAQSEGRQSGGESRNAQSTPLEKNEEKRRGV